MTFEEYIKKIKKVYYPKNTKLNSNFICRDYHKFYKTLDLKYPIVNRDLYRNVISDINILLIEELFNNRVIKLPLKFGSIEIVKGNIKKPIENGKIKYRVDWNKTLKLWYEDKEAESNKILIRRVEKEIFKINYNTSKARYINKTYYSFIPVRSIKQRLKKEINNGYETHLTKYGDTIR